MPSARLPFHPSLVDGAGPGAQSVMDYWRSKIWKFDKYGLYMDYIMSRWIIYGLYLSMNQILVKPVERKTSSVKIPSHALCLKPSPKPRCYAHLIEHSMCGETNDKIDGGALHSLPATLPCRHTCTRTGPPWQWFQYNMRPNICSM